MANEDCERCEGKGFYIVPNYQHEVLERIECEPCMYDEHEWEDAPDFKTVAPEIIKRLMWGPIVGHNVQFDIAHIRAALNRYGYKEAKRAQKITKDNGLYKMGYPQIDTCALSYLFLPTERQNLNALREHFEIDTSRAHSADTDVVVAAAQAYINALNRLVSLDGTSSLHPQHDVVKGNL